MDLRFAEWTEVRTSYEERRHTSRRLNWVRRDPPAKAWRNSFGRHWSHSVIDRRGHLHTASSWEESVLYPERRPVRLQQWFSSVEAPDTSKAKTRWNVRRVRLRSGAADRYECEKVDGNYLVRYVVWTDPSTKLLLKSQQVATDLTTGKVIERVTCDNYVYNHQPPADVFEMPADRPLTTAEELPDPMPEVWADLPPDERTRINQLVAAFDTAWLDADPAGFSTLWHFDAVRRAPSRQQWLGILEQQQGRWSRWEHVVERAQQMDHVVVRVAPSTFTWGPEEMPVLRLHLRLTAQDAGTAHIWTGQTELYVEQCGGELLVVHWELPLKEIEDATH